MYTPRLPLNRTTEGDLLRLGQVFWSWKLCDDCHNKRGCADSSCPSQRSKRLARFFEYYRDIVASYETESRHGEKGALSSHDDLFRIIKELRDDPVVTREELSHRLFGATSTSSILKSDQEHAINLAVKTMVMVNCSSQSLSPDFLEHGIFQVPWRSDVAFSQFIVDIFPMTDHPGFSHDDDTIAFSVDMRTSLTARKLMKRAGLKLKPTEDLRNHLKLDRKAGVVELFHYTAFLKEHLRLTKDQPSNMSVADQLKLGALPRQLVLECLDSMQKILFPLSDPSSKSRSLLQSLISTSSFDPDCLRFESASIRNAGEKDISYLYFGARLADLCEELENPKPRGWIERWLERKSGARYIMMATVAGVAFAVLLGMASLAVSSYQAWLAYQQWQHPVVPGSGQ